MSNENYEHLFPTPLNNATKYKHRSGGGGKTPLPKRNTEEHGKRLLAEYEAVWLIHEDLLSERNSNNSPTRKGAYIDFKGAEGYPLNLKSLEDLRVGGARLANARYEYADERIGEVKRVIATVFVPTENKEYISKKIQAYLNSTGERPDNEDLIARIEEISSSTLLSLWTDDVTEFKVNKINWCEIWVRTNFQDDGSRVELFRAVCELLSIKCKDEEVVFPGRTVVLVEATEAQLTELSNRFRYLAEIRAALQPTHVFSRGKNIVNVKWVADLVRLIEVVKDPDVSICLLDTGVNNVHPLIAPVLSDEDLYVYDPLWGTNDQDGHGSLMAGLAIYGDVQKAVESVLPVKLEYKIESAKIRPPASVISQDEGWMLNHSPDMVERMVANVESSSPDIKRIFCLAVSFDNKDSGAPTLWSALIDQLSFGYTSSNQEERVPRLFVVAAGNIRDDAELMGYPDTNLVMGVESPAQAWNSLTVGAFTERCVIQDPLYQHLKPLATLGGLTPSSRTSYNWNRKLWPQKPDIVMEGGNVGLDEEAKHLHKHDDLGMLTTSHKPRIWQFSVMRDTSAAAALASRLAARIQTRYPEAWPETIRGLIVHSAEWTEAMRVQFTDGTRNKSNYESLLRTVGYGVPNFERATSSAKNRLTLILEEDIQPFYRGNSTKLNEAHFFKLPWPENELMGLEDKLVTLRVTLSYFIQPSPGALGYASRYAYESHTLKFDVNALGESFEEFQKRVGVNKSGVEYKKGEKFPSNAKRWEIGVNARENGTVSSDYISGTGAELSTCRYLAVYPGAGWWKTRDKELRYDDKARYSLIISLSTDSEEVDLYTSVATKIAAQAIEVKTSVSI